MSLARIFIALICILAGAAHCRPSAEPGGGIRKPAGIENCSEGECFHDQWVENGERFVMVSDDGVNVRSGESEGANVVGQLSICERVVVQHVSTTQVQIGRNLGRWIYIQSHATGAEGWVFDAFIAYPSEFEPVPDFRYKRMKVRIGDVSSEFECSQRGQCSLSSVSEYAEQGAARREKKTTGQMHSCGRVFWFAETAPPDFYTFFCEAGGKLQLPYQYLDVGFLSSEPH